MMKPDFDSKFHGQKQVYPSWGEFKRNYEVYEMSAKDKVLANLDLLSLITIYLSFEDILNLSKVGFGCLGDVLKTTRMKDELKKQLFNFLFNKGWGERRPLYGSESFENSQQKLGEYVKIFCLGGLNVKNLFEALLQKFPQAEKNEVKSCFLTREEQPQKCFGENWGVVMTEVGGSLCYMGSTAFILSEMVERYMEDAGLGGSWRKPSWVWKHPNYISRNGCLDEALMAAIISKHEKDGELFDKIQIEGIHLDSETAVMRLETLLNQTKRVGQGYGDELRGYICHLRISTKLTEESWRALHTIMITNAHITWRNMEATPACWMTASDEMIGKFVRISRLKVLFFD